MHDATIITAIEGKYIDLLDDLDERGRRRWAAVEARALGRGGSTAVALATGLSDRTIRTGLKELDDPTSRAGHRQRSGGGRKPQGITQPGLQDALDQFDRGHQRYGSAQQLLVTADSGGSNRSRGRWWQVALQQWADETGLLVEVSHYPPGTSQWNQIEHRVFGHSTRNWQGTPLETLAIVVESIGATTTETGLEVQAWIDEGT